MMDDKIAEQLEELYRARDYCKQMENHFSNASDQISAQIAEIICPFKVGDRVKKRKDNFIYEVDKVCAPYWQRDYWWIRATKLATGKQVSFEEHHKLEYA